MTEATNLKRKPVSAGIFLAMVLIIAAIALVVFLVLNPSILANILHVILTVVVVIAIVAVLMWLIMALLAIPVYFFKGESTPENVSYDMSKTENVKDKDNGEIRKKE